MGPALSGSTAAATAPELPQGHSGLLGTPGHPWKTPAHGNVPLVKKGAVRLAFSLQSIAIYLTDPESSIPGVSSSRFPQSFRLSLSLFSLSLSRIPRMCQAQPPLHTHTWAGFSFQAVLIPRSSCSHAEFRNILFIRGLDFKI